MIWKLKLFTSNPRYRYTVCTAKVKVLNILKHLPHNSTKTIHNVNVFFIFLLISVTNSEIKIQSMSFKYKSHEFDVISEPHPHKHWHWLKARDYTNRTKTLTNSQQCSLICELHNVIKMKVVTALIHGCNKADFFFSISSRVLAV